MPLNPSVVIVIVNWNNWQDTLECLESLRLNKYPRYSILIVDNKSDNESCTKIGQWVAKYDNMDLIETSSNLGFAGGCNIGIRKGLEKGADYILLLNNDTIVETNFLTNLINTAKATRDTGIVSGKILQSHDRKIWYLGGKIVWLRGGGYHPGKGRAEKKGGGSDPFEVNFISGCMMLIKREVFEKTGLLDESYFLYNEDVEFCLRVSRAGIKMMVNPASVIYHKERSTDGGWKPYHIYYLIRNKLILMKRYAPNRIVLYCFYLIIITGGLLFSLSCLLRGRGVLAGSYLRAISDYFSGLEGRTFN